MSPEATATQLAPQVDLEALASKTLFLVFSFESFGNTRKVDVKIDSAANENLIKHQKRLLDSPELAIIKKADAEIKSRISAMCLPYDVGIRFIPNQSVSYVNTMLAEYEKTTRPALVDLFISAYFSQKEQAKIELKELYRESDYPSEEAMRAKFSFRYRFVNFGVPGNLKYISPEVFEAEKQKEVATMQEAATEVIIVLRKGVQEVVTRLLDQLSDKKDGKRRVLREPTVAAVAEAVKNFDTLNVMDDQQLKVEIEKLKLIMAGVNAEKIRESDSFRIQMQQQLGDVAKTLVTLTDVKGRKFRD